MSAKRFVRFIEFYDRDAADMTNIFTQLIEVMGVYMDYCSGKGMEKASQNVKYISEIHRSVSANQRNQSSYIFCAMPCAFI